MLMISLAIIATIITTIYLAKEGGIIPAVGMVGAVVGIVLVMVGHI
jgi:flagellar motor component MotA